MNTRTMTISPEGFYTLEIPVADRTFFLSLVKKMGWTAHKSKAQGAIPTATLAAVADARAHKNGVRVETDTLENFIQSLS